MDPLTRVLDKVTVLVSTGEITLQSEKLTNETTREALVSAQSTGIELRTNVHTTHLLANHDNKAGQRRTANTGNGEKVDETVHVVASTSELEFLDQLGVDVEHVTSSLKLRHAQTAE